MATGLGYFDTQGVWRFGEDDVEVLASDLLNLGQESVSQQFTLDRVRLQNLESDGWVSYAPTLTNVTLGTGGVVTAHHRKSRGTIEVRYMITLGTGGTMGADPTMTLPAPMGTMPSFRALDGMCWNYKASTLVSYPAAALAASASIVRFVRMSDTGGTAIGASAPFAWTVNDRMFGRFVYELA